ncbi:MAG: macro domain-containing protein [Bradymonadaceae bacterium]|nr:macro domain-containing protein [Lujinxingiaceae bacterium]
MERDPQQRRLIVTQGDITLIPLKEGALVNPSNTGLILNSGVGAQIARRGGPFMQQTLHMARSRLRNNRLDPGKALATEPGQLHAKKLIHVAIIGAKKVNNRLISNAILNAYDMADDLELRQVAFPAVGCGVSGFPMDKFLELFWRITAEELPRASHLREVYLCVYEGEEFEAARAYATEHADELPKSIVVEVNETGLAPGMFR